jgi:hypothetical protein
MLVANLSVVYRAPPVATHPPAVLVQAARHICSALLGTFLALICCFEIFSLAQKNTKLLQKHTFKNVWAYEGEHAHVTCNGRAMKKARLHYDFLTKSLHLLRWPHKKLGKTTIRA